MFADGFVADGFERVREAFATEPRGGSALVVIQHGETVVDLREGWRDAAVPGRGMRRRW